MRQATSAPALDTPEIRRTVSWAVRGVPRELRDDARQEAWLGILGAVGRYDGRVKVRTFVARRAAGAVLDFQRHCDPLTRGQRRKVKRGDAPAPERVPLYVADTCVAMEGNQERVAMIAQVRGWLGMLKPRQRQLLELLFAGDSIPEAAEKMGASPQAGYNLWNGAVQRLRFRLRISGRAQ